MTFHHFKIPIFLLLIIALIGRIMVSAIDNGPMDSSWKKALSKMTDKESTADEDGENEGKIKLSDLISTTSDCVDFVLPDCQKRLFSSKDYKLTAADVQALEYPPKFG